MLAQAGTAWARTGREMKLAFRALLAGLLLAATYPGTTIPAVGRRWTYYTSAGVPRAATQPLVVLLHGTGGSGGGFLERSGWADKAQQEGFVAVSPSGLPVHPDQAPDFFGNPRMWNVGLGFGSLERLKIDDQLFILALLADVQKTHRIDPGQIYLVGHSNGAMFAYQLAAAYPRRFAAIAPVAGPPPESPSSAVPTYAVFGQEDQIIPVSGGEVETPWGRRAMKPLRLLLAGWARALGYEGTPEVVLDDELQRTERYGPDLQVTFLKGHGHNYPSSSQPLVDPRFGPVKTEVPVNDQIWTFFQEHASVGATP